MMPCLVMLFFATNPSHVRADVDGLASSLHCPMTYSSQRGG
jgi:hypothetical protein